MRLFSACLTCVVLAAPAFAADELAYGPVPGWVDARVLAQAGTRSDTPVEMLLTDTQFKLEPDSVSTYSHYALRFNNSQGLAAGNVMANWDPAFDTVTVHKVVIRRENQAIDVLGRGEKFSILRRETNLEQQTLNGQLTATLLPENLQVGDILEVEITLERRDPTLRGHMELTSNWAVPFQVEQAQMRLVTPAKARIRQRLADGLPSPTVTREDGNAISTWAFGKLAPETPPAFAPGRFLVGKTLEVSDFGSWSDVASLFQPLFEKASEIPPGSPLHEEIARIRAASNDPVTQAALALQLVEQKVRYVNLALGVGGLVPVSAPETWERRFGDCKAKTALLVGLLRELGIKGVPVLVHTEQGDGLDKRLPMVGLFNHVIVRAEIGGKTYWLDGTRTGDTRLANLEVPYYHWGLPVTEGASLVRMVPPPLREPSIETMIRTDASGGVDGPVPTAIEMVIRGDLAIAQDLILSSLDPSLRDQAVRRQLQSKLDQFEIEKVSTSYDAEAQLYRLRAEGRQKLDLNNGVYWTVVPTLGYKADFTRSGTRDLDAPVAIGYPTFSRDVQVILLPRDRVAKTTFQMDPVNTTVAGVEYRRQVTNKDGIVTIDSTRRSIKPEIPIADALASQDELRRLDKDGIWIRLSDSAPVETAEVKELIGHEPNTADDYFRAALKFLGQQDGPKALGALEKAIEMKPAMAGARLLRSQLRLGLDDLKGAREDAEAALKADPKNVQARMILAEQARREGKFEEALAQAAALAGADSASAQMTRGEILLSLDRPEEALRAFDKALEFEKDPMIHVHRAQALPVSDRDGRRKELAAALKLNPTDAPVLTELARIASQVGEHEQALRLLDQAFLRSPDNITIRHRRAIEMMHLGQEKQANKEFDAIAEKELSAEELNNLCWDKALANVALDRAIKDCDRSLAMADGRAARDSKAMVLLRQSRLEEAIAQFDLALKDGAVAASLYGRSLAYARKGDQARSDADAEEALKLAPNLERYYSQYGLVRKQAPAN